MRQTKLLLDTNTYLRLAQSIHPLLGKEFGKEKHTLYIHNKIEIELNRSSRLQTKFSWIDRKEYVINRKKKLNTSKEDKKNIETNYDYIWEFQKDIGYKLSQEDIYCIATSLELKIPLVTDDQNMIKTCNEFEVTVLSTLQLLKLMFDNYLIDKPIVKQIVEYWEYEKDIPANFKNELQKLFPKLCIEKEETETFLENYNALF